MIRFYNGNYLSFSQGSAVCSGEVWVKDGRISYVGPSKPNPEGFSREIDLKGDLLIPGFKNAHTHTPMTFLRSYADDLPLHDWLATQVWPNEAKLTDDAVYTFAKLGIMEYLAGGVTASFDMYYHNEAYARANADAGFRTVLCGEINDFAPDPEALEQAYLRYNSYDPLVSYKLGIHAEYTTSMERMEYVASLVEKYKAPFYTHCAETRSETEGCIERYGLTPAQLLDRLGLFKYGGGGFHCVWFNQQDIELFAEKKLWAITNPASNLKLASGIAPIVRMQQAGVPLAIGTDGAASNNALDMFREMYLVSVLQKYLNDDAAACSAESVLEMACVGGARAMGLDDCDAIAPGKLADLAVIDMSRANMQPINNVCKNLVYAGNASNVRLTMVNGKILYEDGHYFIGEDSSDIIARANDFMGRLRA